MIFTYESNYLYKIIIILSIVTAECSLAIRSRKFSKENYKKKTKNYDQNQKISPASKTSEVNSYTLLFLVLAIKKEITSQTE